MVKSTFNMRYGLLLMLLIISLSAISQSSTSVTIPYYMGFESSDSLELVNNWHLNPGSAASQCPDQWVVGSATSEDGSRSLYISTNNGSEAVYGAVRNVQYVYRDFVLPSGQSYVVSFDWRCLGSSTSYLCAGCGRANGGNPLNLEAAYNPLGSNLLSAQVTSAIKVNNLYNNGKWNNESFIITGNDQVVQRIFFAWVNGNTDSMKVSLGACIDNFSITSNNVARPHDIAISYVNCDSVILSWQGTAQKYQIDYRKAGNNLWVSMVYQNPTGAVLNNSFVIENLAEGSYNFRLRGITGQDTSAYAFFNNFQLFCPDQHCINYVDLHNKDVVVATIGEETGGYYSGYTINPYLMDSVVDYGPYDKYSRHTVHWEQGFDPNTGGQLPYIPDGEMASVRLGNWNDGSEGESLTYKFHVDGNESSILLMKYAVVLENPSGHSQTENPLFALDILDSTMTVIDPDCGKEEFVAGYGDTKLWHSYVDENSYWGDEILWKEWSIMGLNLERFQGQTIYIRLTTKDCSLGAHYGYAYFVLGCSAAHIDVLSCGSASEMKVQAPDGFAYEWFNSQNVSVSKEQILQLPSSDTTTYRCHLSYLQKPTCGFDIYSKSMPRYPIADFEPEWVPQNCLNRVHFKNTSHIYTDYDNIPVHHYDEPCDTYYWEFLDDNTTSTAAEPYHNFPQEGGTFQVYLRAMIADGDCTHDTIIEFTLPAIKDTVSIDSATLCAGYTMTFDGKLIGKTGDYSFEGKTFAGCDSIVSLHLDVYDASPMTELDTAVLCYGDSLCVDGLCFDFKSDIFRRVLENIHGCDSVVTIPVVVKKEIIAPQLSWEDEGIIPLSGHIDFDDAGTGWTYYTVNGEKNKDLSKLGGGTYILSFVNDSLNTLCQTLPDTIIIAPGCIADVIYQRWSDVLSLYNKEWQAKVNDLRPAENYVAYQWYKNGQKIEGATESYLYVPEGLSSSDTYTCMLTSDSGSTRESCDFHPAPSEGEQVQVNPTQVQRGGVLYVTGQTEGIKVYNALGVLVDSYPSGQQQLQAPSMQGVYIYRLQTADGERSVRVTVK